MTLPKPSQSSSRFFLVLSFFLVFIVGLIVLLCFLLLRPIFFGGSAKPHVILILADDLGFHDVSWHNQEVISPHLHRLASQGIILNRSYAQPTCTPSRAALLTGRYAFKLGMQRGPLGAATPAGLPTKFILLPAYLKQVGYKTHLVGKWHLGYCKNAFMPTKRGFDTHYGPLCGFGDHYNHTTYVLTNDSFWGYDFRDNFQPVRSTTYSTDAFADRVSSLIRSHDPSTPLFLMYSFQAVHIPLQVPMKYYEMYPNVTDENRRTYLGMMTSLDDAVGRLVKDLKAAKMFSDTLFIFSSDNGGMRPIHGASNYPLKGFKDSLWEGGIRVPAFIYSKRLIKNGGRVDNGYVHLVDWAPTILDLAGFDYRSLSLDGISHAKTLLSGRPSQRNGMIVNIDEKANMSAIIRGSWKLIVGSPEYTRFYEDNKRDLSHLSQTMYRLFDIQKDPLEQKNVADEFPKERAALIRELNIQRPLLHKSVPWDDCIAPSDPLHFNRFWSPGWCEENSTCGNL